MTEDEYSALTAVCDALLRAPNVAHERIAVSWLHVRNEHPNHLREYESVFRQPGVLPRTKSRLLDSARVARTLARSVWRPGSDPSVEPDKFPAQVDVLFISHLVSAQIGARGEDFYYGHLPEELASRGLKSLIALQNHVADDERCLKERFSQGGATSRVVLPRWLTLRQESRLLHRARLAASALLRDAWSAPDLFQRRVAFEAASHAATASTIGSLRLHDVVKRLCTRFRPRAVIVTWEGHGWERMAFHAARSVDATVRCIGYQHTVLFPRSHALRRSLGDGFDPDVILTVGDVNGDLLRASDGLCGVDVMTYGSHRRLAAVGQRAHDASTRCLVIPEGLESECLILFDFALAAAARMPDLQFVLRTHPVLPFRWLARRYPHLRSLPSNVRVSDQAAITADFGQCDWALYRGSSAAVHAVLAGARPVYVERPRELVIDPLFALDDWRRRVATVEEFSAVVASDRAVASVDRRSEWEPARAFCDRYVAPPNSDVVYGLLTH